jgi:phage-related baseplate assembly protein
MGNGMNEPTFLSEDITLIKNELLNAYLSSGGSTPASASTEQLMLNACAYSIYRNNVQINDAIRQNFVAFARGAMLDYLAEPLGVTRLDGETDDDFRTRVPLRLEAHAAGGTAGFYRFKAFSASEDLLDVSVINGGGGAVNITLLSKTDATTSDDLALVTAAIMAEDGHALNDTIHINSATPVDYAVHLTLQPKAGYLPLDVKNAITTAITSLNAQWRKLGTNINPSAITQAAMNTGMVEFITEQSPAYIDVPPTAYPQLTEVTVSWA